MATLAELPNALILKAIDCSNDGIVITAGNYSNRLRERGLLPPYRLHSRRRSWSGLPLSTRHLHQSRNLAGHP